MWDIVGELLMLRLMEAVVVAVNYRDEMRKLFEILSFDVRLTGLLLLLLMLLDINFEPLYGSFCIFEDAP